MATQEKFTITIPGPPPPDISTYTRSMHQHTMRQIEQMNKASQIQQYASAKHGQSAYTSNHSATNGVSGQSAQRT